MASDNYYDLRIRKLSTAAHVRKTHGGTIELRGCATGKHHSAEELQYILDDLDGEDAVSIDVTDNGEHGDGLCLMFNSAGIEREGRPEFEKAPPFLFYCDLTVGQARILAEAILCAVRMRTAESISDKEISG